MHIPLGIACLVMGASAMLSSKGRGRHSAFGRVYFWCLLALFGSATVLSIMRLSKNYYLFILGAAAFGCAWFGRSALQLRWPNWGRLHISGISLSYIVMLTAFYVDNGKQLPTSRQRRLTAYLLRSPRACRRVGHLLSQPAPRFWQRVCSPQMPGPRAFVEIPEPLWTQTFRKRFR